MSSLEKTSKKPFGMLKDLTQMSSPIDKGTTASTSGKKFATCSYEDGVALIRENNKKLLAERQAKREANRFALPPHILHADKFQHLSGLTITRVRYMTPKEVEHLGWYKSSIVFEMSDGSLLFPQMDDEGNDGGAMSHITEQGMDTIYTI